MRVRNVLIIIGVLIALTLAILYALYYFTALSQEVTIKDVLANPEKYVNKTVTLRGKLTARGTQGFGMLFFVTDEEGNEIEILGRALDPLLVDKWVVLRGEIQRSPSGELRIFVEEIKLLK
jgi:hypothetical protein